MKPRERHGSVDYDLNVGAALTLFACSGTNGPGFHRVRDLGAALRHNKVGFLRITRPLRLKISPDETNFLRSDRFRTRTQLLQDGLDVRLGYAPRDPQIVELESQIAAHVTNRRIAWG